ncbi:hypothetical protein [Roseovarius sp. Pro17]|uniref:hypothetical protein n=1 Tax=Roseovarius sp. Pro17 TaxID=3108175 RepID=UPI002D77C38D|nr:hypothetical protein [Roseovarius sp. Pro17]
MTSHENTSAATENALNAAQVLFTANPIFLTPQTKHILQAQERFFDEIEKFSTIWFQRRQDATRSLIDAGRRIVSEGGNDPAKAIKELTEWQTHSMERLAEDAKDCTEMMTQCAEALVKNEVEATEETAKNAKKATTTSKSSPV